MIWSKIDELAINVTDHTAVTINSKILIIGGLTEDYEENEELYQSKPPIGRTHGSTFDFGLKCTVYDHDKKTTNFTILKTCLLYTSAAADE